MQKILRLTPALTLLASVLLAGSARRAQDDYCASQPPPAGLVERCHSRLIVVPDDIAAFRLALTEWMDTCVAGGRAVGLVRRAMSVEEVWKRMQDRPAGVRAVRITPKYEPLKFEKDGKICYGVKSVEFALPSGTVLSERHLAEILEIKANDIQRSFNFLLMAQNGDSRAPYCPGLRDALKPTVGQFAKKGKTTVYGYY